MADTICCPGDWDVYGAVLYPCIGYAADVNDVCYISIITGIALDRECTDLLVRDNGYRQEIKYMISLRSKVVTLELSLQA